MRHLLGVEQEVSHAQEIKDRTDEGFVEGRRRECGRERERGFSVAEKVGKGLFGIQGILHPYFRGERRTECLGEGCSGTSP